MKREMKFPPIEWSVLLSCLAVAGCAVGPDYRQPTVETPAAYKESGPTTDAGKWKSATPQDAIARGNWWEIYGDPALNALEVQATQANQTLKAAMARVEQSRAIARVSKADFYPTITLDPGYTRFRESANRPAPPGTPSGAFTASDFSAPFDLSYEIDLWGRVRRTFEAARAEAQASVADYESVLLTLKADVAQNYFALRALDNERDLLRRTVELRGEELELVQTRFQGGISTELDVTRARTELASAKSDATGLDRRRAELEHALAVLVGKPAAEFSIAEKIGSLPVPQIPPGVPSDLLERRPDIAEAERRMAAENARIGVAQAAFFPVVRLTGSVGLDSSDIATLFSAPSRTWSFGPSVSLPIFEGGRNQANLNRSRASFDETVANYRQTVLVAFREVEDGLSGLRTLEQQIGELGEAVAAAKRTADISSDRYRTGLVSYLDVVDAERTALFTERLATQIQGLQLITSVQLIKALGGGWQDSQLRLSAK